MKVRRVKRELCLAARIKQSLCFLFTMTNPSLTCTATWTLCDWEPWPRIEGADSQPATSHLAANHPGTWTFLQFIYLEKIFHLFEKYITEAVLCWLCAMLRQKTKINIYKYKCCGLYYKPNVKSHICWDHALKSYSPLQQTQSTSSDI